MDKKKFTPKLGLLVKSKIDGSFAGMSGYLTITAEPVTIGPRKDYEIGHTAPGEVYSCSLDHFDAINGLWLGHLMAYCQGNDEPGKRNGVYAFQIRYQEIFAAELNEVERMHKTLKTVHRRLDKMNEKFGRITPGDFGQFVGRFANAIGAVEIIEGRNQQISPRRGTGPFKFMNLEDGVDWINWIVREWQKLDEPKEQTA